MGIATRCKDFYQGGNKSIFPGVAKRIFSMGGQQWWNFILPTRK